eukprot:1095595-Pyramimonas_sp.AAC.1
MRVTAPYLTGASHITIANLLKGKLRFKLRATMALSSALPSLPWYIIGMAGIIAELRTQRFKWYHKICCYPLHHQLRISAMFGIVIQAPDAPDVDHPWFQQLQAYIQALPVLESAYFFEDASRLQLIGTDALRDVFIEIGVFGFGSKFRQHRCSTARPGFT